MSATDRFERFHWLHEHYADIASQTNTTTASPFERWELLWNHLRPLAYLVGPRNLEALDHLENAEKTELLDWLETQHSRKASPKLSDRPSLSQRPLRLQS